jgi:hypothetical protein
MFPGKLVMIRAESDGQKYNLLVSYIFIIVVMLENNITMQNPTFDLNFSTQNVCSLNISTKNIITDKKIMAIVGMGNIKETKVFKKVF